MITLTPNAAEVVRSNINREKLSVDTALRLGVKNDGLQRIAAPNIAMWWNSIRMLFRPDDHLFRERRNPDPSLTARAWLIWMGSS